jgi:hypothetical protein
MLFTNAGYKTTEFWLSLLAMVLGVVMASGVIPQGGLAAQIIGGCLSVLAGLGYTASRTQIKVADTVTPESPELPNLPPKI